MHILCFSRVSLFLAVFEIVLYLIHIRVNCFQDVLNATMNFEEQQFTTRIYLKFGLGGIHNVDVAHQQFTDRPY